MFFAFIFSGNIVKAVNRKMKIIYLFIKFQMVWTGRGISHFRGYRIRFLYICFNIWSVVFLKNVPLKM